ncbi:hypothetical protein SNEBB_002690 [Seison nebaliae]|nr:hypothetical protein SNEBB_002690 [Seison nebaliae]
MKLLVNVSLVFFFVAVTQCLAESKSKCFDVDRNGWGARSPSKVSKIGHTPHYVVIHHSATGACTATAACQKSIRRYNFIIGEDGKVYEGRGYGIWGAHSPAYNSNSIGICMVGTFTNRLPNQKAIQRLKDFIKCSKQNGYITDDYDVRGHRDSGQITECPGQKLYDEIHKNLDKYHF